MDFSIGRKDLRERILTLSTLMETVSTIAQNSSPATTRLSNDEDGDGMSMPRNLAAGTNPFNVDTDGDGVNDNIDAFPLDPTRTTAPTGTPGDVTAPTITLTRPVGATLNDTP